MTEDVVTGSLGPSFSKDEDVTLSLAPVQSHRTLPQTGPPHRPSGAEKDFRFDLTFDVDRSY